MSVSEVVDQIAHSFREHADGLQEEHDQIEDRQEYPYEASWDAAAERAEPMIKKDAIEDCLDEVKDCSNFDDLLEVLADWRKESDELDKRILDSREWFRKSTRRFQLDRCIEELEDAIPESEFEKCSSCGRLKTPVSDKRRRTGYRWDCIDCPAYSI